MVEALKKLSADELFDWLRNPDDEVVVQAVRSGVGLNDLPISQMNLTVFQFICRNDLPLTRIEVQRKITEKTFQPMLQVPGSVSKRTSMLTNADPSNMDWLVELGCSVDGVTNGIGRNGVASYVEDKKTTPPLIDLLLQLGNDPPRSTFNKIKKLIELEADPNNANHGTTPLICISSLKSADKLPLYAEIFQLLLDCGADVHWRDLQGSSALLAAQKNSNASAMLMLLQHGAQFDLNSQQLSNAAFVAVAENRADLLDELCKAPGWRALIETQAGSHFLQDAYIRDSTAALIWLLKHGCYASRLGGVFGGRSLIKIDADHGVTHPHSSAVFRSFLRREAALSAVTSMTPMDPSDKTQSPNLMNAKGPFSPLAGAAFMRLG